MSYTTLLQARSFLCDSGACIFLLVTCLLPLNSAGFTTSDPDPFTIRGFDCSRIDDLGINKQMNLRAGAILRYCATGRTDIAQLTATLIDLAYPPSGLSLLGGADINLITGTETFPRVTQAESCALGKR